VAAEYADARGVEPSAPRRTALERAADLLVSVLEVYCAILMVGMAVIVLLGVFYRYVVERALPWYDEFAEFLLVWLTFYGSVLASHRGAHIGFETLVAYLPARPQRWVAVISEVVILVIQAALFYYGWSLVQAASFDTAISIRWVRLSWIYSAIPISGGFMFLIGLRRLTALLRSPRL
jgi:TRAP-type C4-dicarboxylate transport system permease small subunit